jgi:tRNA 2-selenouridine synthase SelU
MQVANHHVGRNSGGCKATLRTITKEVFTQTFSGDSFVLFNLSESGKEGKVEGLPSYCRTGIVAVECREKSGILRMVPECVW